MATLLQIQSSLFNGHGQSSALTRQFTEQWLAANPEGTVIDRNLAAEPVPHLDQSRFQAFISTPEDRTEDQQTVLAYSDALIDEIRRADTIVLGAPMYNFGVPSVLRAYFDHIARAGITFRYTAEGAEGLLTGKKAYVFITRGGFYGEEHSQSQYLRQFLAFIGITDVEIIHAEGLAINDDSRQTALKKAEKQITRLLA